ncbi:ABC transporter ATP-binding protein [Gordonia sp. NPDC003424]
MIAAVSGVTVRFGHRIALDDVTVEIPGGTVVAVVGGDGAGKSTLLRTLARQVSPDSGVVDSVEKHHMGFLPAGPGSWGALTVRQNLDFAGGMYGLAGTELRSRREEMIERAGLGVAADRQASALSGGMRRKLGASMAMIHRPSLVLLDEPSTGVDPVSRIDLWRMVSEVAAEGAGVLMSTTYLDEAERAGHLVVLDGGRVLVQGSYRHVHETFAGTITVGRPVRPEWSWRRGRERHEYWPEAAIPQTENPRVDPDLEDIVIAMSVTRRMQAGVA